MRCFSSTTFIRGLSYSRFCVIVCFILSGLMIDDLRFIMCCGFPTPQGTNQGCGGMNSLSFVRSTRAKVQNFLHKNSIPLEKFTNRHEKARERLNAARHFLSVLAIITVLCGRTTLSAFPGGCLDEPTGRDTPSLRHDGLSVTAHQLSK